LREKAITTPYDLSNSTPGITATAGSSSRNDVQYFIRGQGATYGSTPSVVTYFADVPQQAASTVGGSNITFYDLEAVQVLKGPQGTLFGRSTTAGAVLLTPKKPTGEFDGFFEMSLGNYNLRQFTGAINIPILGDRFAVRVSGNYSVHDGFARSLTTGRDLDDRDRSSYRITVLARPTDWLTNTTIFSDINVKENGTASILGHYEPDGITPRSRRSASTRRLWGHRLVCLEKIGPFLKRAREGERNGELYGTSAIYTGADHREAA
jgi:iron complex outermembrane receptor protein